METNESYFTVEVLGGNQVWYKAFIKNIYNEELGVFFENDFESEKRIPFCEVRLCPKNVVKSEYKQGEEVEVLTKSCDSELLGWWPARIKMMKGEFAVVDYIGFNLTYSDIKPIELIRPRNLSGFITPDIFHRLNIDIPTDITKLCCDISSHAEFKKTTGVEFIKFDSEKNKLNIVSLSESCIKKANILSDMHIRNLKQKSQLLQITEEISKKLENTRLLTIAPFSEKLKVQSDLMGLAIGHHGANISRARNIEGIVSIDLDEETNTFKINGETQEAVNKAKKLLEYVEEHIYVPQHLVANVIGKSGHTINDILNTSGVVRVRISDNVDKHDDEEENDDNLSEDNSSKDQHQINDTTFAISGKVKNDEDKNGIINKVVANKLSKKHCGFYFVGTSESIANAKLLIEYQIIHLKEVDRLRLEKEQIDAELKIITGNHYQAFSSHQQDRRSEDGAYGKDRRSNRRGGRSRGDMDKRGSLGGYQMETHRGNKQEECTSENRDESDKTTRNTALGKSENIERENGQMKNRLRGRGRSSFAGGKGGNRSNGGQKKDQVKKNETSEESNLDQRKISIDDNYRGVNKNVNPNEKLTANVVNEDNANQDCDNNGKNKLEEASIQKDSGSNFAAARGGGKRNRYKGHNPTFKNDRINMHNKDISKDDYLKTNVHVETKENEDSSNKSDTMKTDSVSVTNGNKDIISCKDNNQNRMNGTINGDIFSNDGNKDSDIKLNEVENKIKNITYDNNAAIKNNNQIKRNETSSYNIINNKVDVREKNNTDQQKNIASENKNNVIKTQNRNYNQNYYGLNRNVGKNILPIIPVNNMNGNAKVVETVKKEVNGVNTKVESH